MSRSLMQEVGYLWIVKRQQRPLAEGKEEGAQPQPTHRDRRYHIPDAEVEVSALMGEIRNYVPVNIDDPHAHQEHCNADQATAGAFALSRQQQAKRQREVEEDDDKSDNSPSSMDAVQEPANLFGQVAGPDNEPLREGEVSEQHDEGQHQLTQIMKLRRLDDLTVR